MFWDRSLPLLQELVRLTCRFAHLQARTDGQSCHPLVRLTSCLNETSRTGSYQARSRDRPGSTVASSGQSNSTNSGAVLSFTLNSASNRSRTLSPTSASANCTSLLPGRFRSSGPLHVVVSDCRSQRPRSRLTHPVSAQRDSRVAATKLARLSAKSARG